MSRRNLHERGRAVPAGIVSQTASCTEMASFRYVGKGRHRSLNHWKLFAAFHSQVRNTCKKSLCVRMAWILKKLLCLCFFYDLSQIHDFYTVADSGHNSHIMCDKQH